MKKTYLYYGTEENFYEIEKHESTNITEDTKTFLQDVVDENEAEAIAEEMKCELNVDGFATYEDEDEHGYQIFFGFAEQGHCQVLRNILNEKRRECMEMAGF